MRKKTPWRLVTILLATVSSVAGADEFSDYVEACKSELGFSAIPQVSCKEIGFRGAPAAGPVFLSDDHVGHRAMNSDVDAGFACRGVQAPAGFPETAGRGGSL